MSVPDVDGYCRKKSGSVHRETDKNSHQVLLIRLWFNAHFPALHPLIAEARVGESFRSPFLSFFVKSCDELTNDDPHT